jgi:hypothetical protein
MILWKERYLHIFLIIISSLLYFWIIPSQVQEGESRVLPYLCTGIILLCSVACLVKVFRGKEEVTITFPRATIINLTLGILFYGLYIFLIEYIGYFSITFVFIMLIFWHIKVRKPLQIILIAIIVPLAIYLLMSVGLNVVFPTSFLP